MSKQIDTVRALKDKDYFSTLTSDEQATARAAAGVGPSDITDESLESVSGGLEGSGGRSAHTTSAAACAGSEMNSRLVYCSC